MSSKFSRRAFLGSTMLSAAMLTFRANNIAFADDTSDFKLFEDGNKDDYYNSNINPLGNSPKLKKALSRVPDVFADYAMSDFYEEILLNTLSKNYQIKKDEIFLGPGSRCVAYFLIDGLKKAGFKRFILPDQDYEVMGLFAREVGLEVAEIQVQLEKKPTIDMALLGKLLRPNDIFYLSRPNMPAAFLVDQKLLVDLIEKNPKVFFLIDEAYIQYIGEDYAQKSFINKIEKYSNLAVLRTFSKIYGLASMRIGYVATKRTNIAKFMPRYKKFRVVTSLGAFLANEAMADIDFLQQSRAEVLKLGERAKSELAVNGWTAGDLGLNYVYFWKKAPAKILMRFNGAKVKEKTKIGIYQIGKRPYLSVNFCLPPAAELENKLKLAKASILAAEEHIQRFTAQ